jgi:hypothetical protein
MTDFLAELHAQAGLDRLRANPNLTVFDGKVPDPTPDPATDPWVLVYTQVAWPREGLGVSLNGTQVGITTTFVCHCAAGSAQGARALADQVRDSLLNYRPVIAGRNCGPIKQDDELPPGRDETTGKLVMTQISTYSYLSTG